MLAWDAQNPGNTWYFMTSTSTYDSPGTEHKLTPCFRKAGANTWDYKVPADGSEITAGVAGTNVEIGNGALAFAADALGNIYLASREVGESVRVGQIATARFAAVDRLQWIGDHLFVPTLESGDARVGTPTTEGRGSVTQGALEKFSNTVEPGCVHQ